MARACHGTPRGSHRLHHMGASKISARLDGEADVDHTCQLCWRVVPTRWPLPHVSSLGLVPRKLTSGLARPWRCRFSVEAVPRGPNVVGESDCARDAMRSSEHGKGEDALVICVPKNDETALSLVFRKAFRPIIYCRPRHSFRSQIRIVFFDPGIVFANPLVVCLAIALCCRAVF